MTRSIIHADMDAFYASVEQKDDVRLAGKAVIVGGSPESRGVVSAASYEARKFGVHSAMPTSQAKRLCPDAIFLPVRMSRYREVSREIRKIFEQFTPLVEPLALDEAFLDVTGSTRLFGAPIDIARRIKSEVKARTELTVSVGVAPNKYLAKLASDIGKPDGLVEITEEEKQDFLDPLDITRLWGIGRGTADTLKKSGIKTIADLRKVPVAFLERAVGKNARNLLDLAHGVDSRPVVPDARAKSIGSESTFAHDVTELEVMETTLLQHVETVAFRLRAAGLRGRSVHLKVRFADFKLSTRSVTLDSPTDRTDLLYETVRDMLQKDARAKSRPVRLIGMSVSHLTAEPARQMGLFTEAEDERRRELDRAVDAIRNKMGRGIIKPARLLPDREEK